MNGFQIKDFKSVTAGIINRARSVTQKITDYAPGSVARTLMEAPAAEMEELYLQMLLGLRDAIPVATYLSFDFGKLPPSRATGFVAIALDPVPESDTTISAGAVFRSSDGREYRSTEDVAWPAGAESIRVPVESTAVGSAGNIAAGAINSTTLSDRPYAISNPAVTSGRDVETDAEQKARFAGFIQSLSRGTMVGCRFAVASAMLQDADGNVSEYVTRIGELEAPGYVRYWVYSNHGIPSPELLGLAQRMLDGWRNADGSIVQGYRPAGVRVDALPMEERELPMSIQVSMYPGYDLDAATKQRITDVFETEIRAVPAGGSVFLKKLVEKMLAVNGVRLIVPDRTENIYCAASEALIPGQLGIEPL